MPEDTKNEAWWKPGFEIFSQISVWVVIPIVAALIIGKWLDGRYGTRPWIFLGLSGLGFLISTFGIVRTVRTYIRNIEKNGKPDEPKQ
jgi:F0F1-type ATP synthase assembly protein I